MQVSFVSQRSDRVTLAQSHTLCLSIVEPINNARTVAKLSSSVQVYQHRRKTAVSLKVQGMMGELCRSMPFRQMSYGGYRYSQIAPNGHITACSNQG